MKETIRQNASLEALSKKSFKKYLKSLLKDKEKFLDNSGTMVDTHELKKKVQYEYYLLCQVLDDYKYYQARKKEINKDTFYSKKLRNSIEDKKDKGDSCRI